MALQRLDEPGGREDRLLRHDCLFLLLVHLDLWTLIAQTHSGPNLRYLIA